jgi:hypothetical protein
MGGREVRGSVQRATSVEFHDWRVSVFTTSAIRCRAGARATLAR